jgi:hypothetical protein
MGRLKHGVLTARSELAIRSSTTSGLLENSPEDNSLILFGAGCRRIPGNIAVALPICILFFRGCRSARSYVEKRNARYSIEAIVPRRRSTAGMPCRKIQRTMKRTIGSVSERRQGNVVEAFQA